MLVKKIVIAGCRNFTDYTKAEKFIDNCIINIRKKYELIFISGGCRGADLLGEKYALKNGFNIERYPAKWDKYGLKAGPLRNEEMAKVCDFVICFWDGKSRGTENMINLAEKYNKPLKIKYI